MSKDPLRPDALTIARTIVDKLTELGIGLSAQQTRAAEFHIGFRVNEAIENSYLHAAAIADQYWDANTSLEKDELIDPIIDMAFDNPDRQQCGSCNLQLQTDGAVTCYPHRGSLRYVDPMLRKLSQAFYGLEPHVPRPYPNDGQNSRTNRLIKGSIVSAPDEEGSNENAG